jgi:hypothetical protein
MSTTQIPPGTPDGATTGISQPRSRWRRPWWQYASFVIMLLPALGIVIYVVGFFLLLPGHGLKPDLPETRIMTRTSSGILEPMDNGTYIQTREGKLYALYPYSQISPEAPPDLAVFSQQDMRYIVMRQNAFGYSSQYQLFIIGSNNTLYPVPIDMKHIPVPGVASVTITPHSQVWAPGTYAFNIPGDGMDDEDFWYYFAIK